MEITIMAWRPPVDSLQVESVVDILKVFEFAANYSKHNAQNDYKIELINEYLFFLESKCGGAENLAFYNIIGYDLSAPVVWATDSFPINDDYLPVYKFPDETLKKIRDEHVFHIDTEWAEIITLYNIAEHRFLTQPEIVKGQALRLFEGFQFKGLDRLDELKN